MWWQHVSLRLPFPSGSLSCATLAEGSLRVGFALVGPAPNAPIVVNRVNFAMRGDGTVRELLLLTHYRDYDFPRPDGPSLVRGLLFQVEVDPVISPYLAKHPSLR